MSIFDKKDVCDFDKKDPYCRHAKACYDAHDSSLPTVALRQIITYRVYVDVKGRLCRDHVWTRGLPG